MGVGIKFVNHVKRSSGYDQTINKAGTILRFAVHHLPTNTEDDQGLRYRAVAPYLGLTAYHNATITKSAWTSADRASRCTNNVEQIIN